MSLLSRVIRKPADFVEHQVHKVKEGIREEVSEKVHKLILVISLAVLMLFAVLFLSIGLAIYFNLLFDSAVSGFFIVAGIYVLLFAILFVIRRKDYLSRKLRQYADLFTKSMY
ncbi:phage holin family protein [Fulvivirga sp. 29W222]|uniref:Phage holin family protein n=1 Tax=Fulvivirga marina TaxID=2494733 RepID=A0A937FW10_9BACT|nr:phage holin family protein [Fulvivirga marina]MBL6446038.1 phage holin family protein [Fulvivirga marina]